MYKFQLLLIGLLVFFSSKVVGKHDIYLKKVVRDDIVQISYEFVDKASSEKEQEFTKLISEAFQVYTELFKGLPRDLEGKEYNEFVVRVGQGKFIGGEADPKIIILTWSNNKLFGYATWKTLLLHELFHLWSAESFRYADAREHWFNEGFAEFYAYQTAAKLGIVSQEEVMSIAAHPIANYITAKNLGTLSMREAAKNNKSKFDNYFLVYNGGWVVAMVLDHEIRKSTESEKSLDNLMQWIYANFKRHEKLYSFEDILFGMKINYGIEANKFIAMYVQKENRIPISNYLNIGRVKWDSKFNQKRNYQHTYLYQTLGVSGYTSSSKKIH